MANRLDITVERILQLIDYDRSTKTLKWKIRTPDMFLKKRRPPEVACATSTIKPLKVQPKKSKNKKPKTKEEKKQAQRESAARWLAKPGNKERHAISAEICRQRHHAKDVHRKCSRDRAASMREEEKIRVAKWRKDNPEKATESHRRYYENNTDKVKAATKKFRLENPDLYAEYERQYKGSKRAGGGRLSRGYLGRLLHEQNGLCNACGCDLFISGHHLDHIEPISKGGLHCDDNVQLLCPTCNRRKSARNFEDFLLILRSKNEWSRP